MMATKLFKMNFPLSKSIWLAAASAAAMGLFLSSQANARVDAIYTVPVGSPELLTAAEYKTRSEQNAYGSPDRTGVMLFSLPAQLTGVDADFEMKRMADGSWDGTGTDGSQVGGECVREDKKWFTCQVAFTGLKFDQLARETLLETQFGRGFEFNQRDLVARHFEGQPIGIIKVRIDRD
jgi:hypothetical protein